MSDTFLMRSGYDGLDISVLVTMPESRPLAVLQLAHGMRGCKERFLPFMSYLADHGVVCVANDHRGHGESVLTPEDRGYMYSGGYMALIEDMRMLTDWIHFTYPGIPVFLLGQSMGSLAVRTYLKSYDDRVDGAFLCGSPGGGSMVEAALAFSRFLAVFRKGRFRPRMLQKVASDKYNRRFRSEGTNAWTCSDPSVRQDFADNPSCNFDFTANGILALISLMKESDSPQGWHVSNPDMPVCFISGEDDPCMKGEDSLHRSAQLMADLGYRNVTSALYSGMRHEVLNEIGKEIVWADILDHVKLWS